jgi:hypothetical protein
VVEGAEQIREGGEGAAGEMGKDARMSRRRMKVREEEFA